MVGSVDLITHTMLEKEAVNWYVAVGQYLGSPDKKKTDYIVAIGHFLKRWYKHEVVSHTNQESYCV